MVTDHHIFGTSSQNIRERLLQSGSKLTIQVARTCTKPQVQLKTASTESTSHRKQEVDVIKKNQNRLWKPNTNQTENYECYFCLESIHRITNAQQKGRSTVTAKKNVLNVSVMVAKLL